MNSNREERIIIGMILFVVTPLVLLIAKSTYWAAMVPVCSAFVGLVSKEELNEKLATMSDTALGVGLVCTLLGLGMIIGPAIAAHNVDAIGYGVSVKIEATVTGISLSLILNAIISRRVKWEEEKE